MQLLVEYFHEHTFLVTLFTSALLLWIVSELLKLRKLPPGPFGLPIVGYLPFMTRKPYLKLDELRKKYGDVYRLRMGSQKVVILSGFQAIKEAFSRDAFFGRPPDLPFFSKEAAKYHVFDGLKWKEQRRFSMHMLRDLGFGKSRMEDHIMEEIRELLERMKEREGQATDLRPLLVPSMSNNISSMLFGRRMEYEDPKRTLLNSIIRDVTSSGGQTSPVLFFPWLRDVLAALKWKKFGIFQRGLDGMKKFIREEILQHEETLDENNIRDYIDGYILEMRRRKNDPENTFVEPVLSDLVRGFFGAGSDTVRTLIDWLILIMAAFPEVQEKVVSEIDKTVGRERTPTYVDQQHMPYTQAVIMETMRWRTIVPINIVRYTLEDSILEGYLIPKGTSILANFWSVHNDREHWILPEVFRPERFLAKGEVVKSEFLIPFSIGKRSCPGELLARIEGFLYLASILQKFQIDLPPGSNPDFEGELGISLQPKAYKVSLTSRV